MAPSPGTPLGGERPSRCARARGSGSGADVPMAIPDGDEDMDDAALGGGREHCPIPGCVAHCATGHAGWGSAAAPRARMNAHQLGALPGAPPVDWLRAKGLTVCPECSRLVSRRCNGGVHRTCMGARLSRRPPRPLLTDGDQHSVDQTLASLPSLDEIFSAPVATRDFVSAGLLPIAEKEFLRCLVQVLQHKLLWRLGSHRQCW